MVDAHLCLVACKRAPVYHRRSSTPYVSPDRRLCECPKPYADPRKRNILQGAKKKRLEELSVGRLIVGIGAGLMVGAIDNLADLGKSLTDSLLHTLIQGHADHAVALTATPKPDIDDVVVHLHEFDVATMTGDCRIDLRIE